MIKWSEQTLCFKDLLVCFLDLSINMDTILAMLLKKHSKILLGINQVTQFAKQT